MTPDLVPHLRRARDHIDRHSAQPLDLDRLAAVAGVSKYHFARRFEATFGTTPIRNLTRRRIERAQDLLRHADLTVTEVCTAVGFASLGSFSARFTALTGEPPTAYRARWAERDDPHVPGCHLFMRGVLDPAGTGATWEKRSAPVLSYGSPMITDVSLVTVCCLDQDATRDFYVGVLGFTLKNDITLGEGFRWLTVGHANQPELDVVLATPGPPLDGEAAAFIRRQLEKGQMGGLGVRVDDCRATFEELSARGVTFLQEPADRPYGVEAVMRDNTGNWLVLVEPKAFSADDFT